MRSFRLEPETLGRRWAYRRPSAYLKAHSQACGLILLVRHQNLTLESDIGVWQKFRHWSPALQTCSPVGHWNDATELDSGVVLAMVLVVIPVCLLFVFRVVALVVLLVVVPAALLVTWLVVVCALAWSMPAAPCSSQSVSGKWCGDSLGCDPGHAAVMRMPLVSNPTASILRV